MVPPGQMKLLLRMSPGYGGGHAGDLLCDNVPVGSVLGAKRPDAGEEVRAVWVVRHSLSSATAARAVVEEAYGAGFNTLIVQVRGRGDALYHSTLEPRPEFLAGEPDSMR